MVITPDFESGNWGSNPHGTLFLFSSVIERAAVNRKVIGSNPVGGAFGTLV